MKPRVAIVVSHPIQHFCPLYRALSKEGDIEVKVLFGSRDGLSGYFDPGFNRIVQWPEDITFGFDHEFLPGSEKVSVTRSVSNRHLKKRLQALDPDVVQTYGFWHGISRQAIFWARSNGRRSLLVSDSELRTPRSAITRLRKRVMVPWLLGKTDAFLTVGDCNEEYYLHYGVRPEQLFRSPYPIDDASLSAALRQKEELRRRTRADLGVPENAVLAVVVGKLTKRKCPEHMILALASMKQSHNIADVRVVFAGDGPQRASLECLARIAAPGCAYFPGFIKPDTLPAFYMASDLLVHPSSEDPHPLATSEAVFCGLPVVVSDRVGSVGPTDDVRLGENGLEYHFGDIGALASAIEAMTDERRRAKLAARSLEIGRERTMAVSVRGFLRAVFAAVGGGSTPG